jgi:hypothetical protein
MDSNILMGNRSNVVERGEVVHFGDEPYNFEPEFLLLGHLTPFA